MDDKTIKQCEFFKNRIVKRYKHLKKWAKRENIECFRIYDNDIPEIPIALDFYNGNLHMYLYERPYEKPLEAEEEWLSAMKSAASEALSISEDCIFTKMRKRQRKDGQYEKLASKKREFIVQEGSLSFVVNLSEYVDTGLFLDHRITRSIVRTLSKDARVLNLFCYTGSFSVYACAGGAKSVTSVDISNTYLAWAEKNIVRNGFAGENPETKYVRADAALFLKDEKQNKAQYDLVILDPPTFSNSKKAIDDFDVLDDWHILVNDVLSILSPNGILVFSTNARKFKMDERYIPNAKIENITLKTIPPDYEGSKIHQCFLISHKK